MTRNLPPLNALKAFEAAARNGGYVAAARELSVTPAAVSQQVKNLERFFGKQLFVRHRNRLSLSDAGLAVFADSAPALERLAAMTLRTLQGEVRSRLIVSVLPSVASHWLIGRLNRGTDGFLGLAPALRLDLRVEEDPVDFARHEIDVRICYGAHLYPDLANTVLVRDEVVPLCAPALLSQGAVDPGAPDSLADTALIHTNWGPSFASHPTWADWFARAGLDRTPDAGQGHRVGMSSLAIDLAAAGAGIALCQRLLAGAALDEGRLVAPFGPSIPLGHPYCAVHAHAKAQKPAVKAFVDWAVRSATGEAE
jgi:LysR family glycine cleavage system transcriptional activator